MIHDALARFSNSQAVTASAASTDIMDLGEERRIGTGKPVYLVVQTTVVMADSGSDSTVTATLESDSAEAFSSATTVLTLPVFAAETAAGTRRMLAIPPDVLTERYIRVYYTVANGNLTTGSFDAFLTESVDAIQTYADNVTIS